MIPVNGLGVAVAAYLIRCANPGATAGAGTKKFASHILARTSVGVAAAALSVFPLPNPHFTPIRPLLSTPIVLFPSCTQPSMRCAADTGHCEPERGRPATDRCGDDPLTSCAGNGAGADPAADTKIEEGEDDVVSKQPKTYATFEEMGLKKNLLRGIFSYGMERPSPLQQRGIVQIVRGRDTVLHHRSGTGATTNLAIGTLQGVDPSVAAVQAIFLVPTRELAIATLSHIQSLGDFLSLKMRALVGSSTMRDDIKALREGIHIAVGTPGRVLTLMQRRIISLARIELVVFDCLDWMLRLGFNDQLLSILAQDRPNDTQLCAASTVMGPQAEALVAKHMYEPVTIATPTEVQLSLDGVRQFHINVEREAWKADTLHDLLETLNFGTCVVFASTRRKVQYISQMLAERGIDNVAVTLGMEADARADAVRRFRNGSARVLVCAHGVAMSGGRAFLSITNLSICYDLPPKDVYIRCFGRSGAYGTKCVGISFITTDDVSALRDIEQYYSTAIEEMPMDIDSLLR